MCKTVRQPSRLPFLATSNPVPPVAVRRTPVRPTSFVKTPSCHQKFYEHEFAVSASRSGPSGCIFPGGSCLAFRYMAHAKDGMLWLRVWIFLVTMIKDFQRYLRFSRGSIPFSLRLPLECSEFEGRAATTLGCFPESFFFCPHAVFTRRPYNENIWTRSGKILRSFCWSQR